MEPRLIWNKIVLAAKQFYFISYVVPCWNKIILKNFRPDPLPLVTRDGTTPEIKK